MNRSAAVRQQLALWGLVLGLWCLLVLAFAGHLVFTNQLAWPVALQLSSRDWAPWAFLAPAVAWLAFRFPLERPRLAVNVPIHVLACMLAVLVCELLARPPGLPARRPTGPLPSREVLPGEPPDAGPLPNDLRPPPGPSPFRGPFGPPRLGGRPALWRTSLGRAQFSIPIYWVIVSIVHTLRYYRRSEERRHQALELEARLTEAKLQALRMQLHPHFLFNTLNAISTLVHKNPEAADEMLANLSELLRATLDTTQQEIPLRQELAFLDRYLEIQQARFGERLQIEKELDAAALEARVPTLILQPLVENAIRHGIEPQTGVGRVRLQARRTGPLLSLIVHDNGSGLKSSAQPPEGIGLANTRARLQQLYGDSAQLRLKTSPEGGCSVELEIPFRE